MSNFPVPFRSITNIIRKPSSNRPETNPKSATQNSDQKALDSLKSPIKVIKLRLYVRIEIQQLVIHNALHITLPNQSTLSSPIVSQNEGNITPL